MSRDKQDITDAEMAVMQVLWAHGPVSIRQIADALHGEGRVSAAQYATVQKQLDRLEKKGFVRRDRTLFAHLFSAATVRDALIGRRLRDMADKLCEGSLAPVLSHLFKARSLTGDERRELRRLFAELYEADDDRPKRSKR